MTTSPSPPEPAPPDVPNAAQRTEYSSEFKVDVLQIAELFKHLW